MELSDFANLDQELIDEIHSSLEQGRKIEAIKRLREATGVDLKTAKQAVEMVERVRVRKGSGDGTAGHAAVSRSSGCGSVLLLGAIASAVWVASVVVGG